METYFPVVRDVFPETGALATCISAWTLEGWKDLPLRFLVTSSFNLKKKTLHRHIFADTKFGILHFTPFFEGNDAILQKEEPLIAGPFPGHFCTLPTKYHGHFLFDWPYSYLWKYRRWHIKDGKGFRACIYNKLEEIPSREEYFKKHFYDKLNVNYF